MAVVEKIRSRHMKVGIAISPDTPSTAISDELGEIVDMLLVMTVQPGTNRSFNLRLGLIQV
jgi:ribulose-phosphate 3-epimerase